jgi:protein TonB
MPVYATAPAFAGRGGHPNAMLVIVGAHVALIAAVMSAKIDLPARILKDPIVVEMIPAPRPPPPVEPPPEPRRQPQPRDSFVERAEPLVPVPLLDSAPLDRSPVTPALPNPGDVIGPGTQPVPLPQPAPRADPVRTGPRLLTPAHLVEPPYPQSKIAREEEASLKLRLSIGANGRVTAVEPVGFADPAFLEAARRHLIARWRYKPATEDGRPVASTTVITLRFELEG